MLAEFFVIFSREKHVKNYKLINYEYAAKYSPGIFKNTTFLDIYHLNGIVKLVTYLNVSMLYL